MRLVDADALIEVTFCIEGDVREGIIMTPLEVVHEYTKAIDTAPTIEAEPVRKGTWVKARGSWCTPGGDPLWECSECGKGRHVYGIEHNSYGSDVSDGQ